MSAKEFDNWLSEGTKADKEAERRAAQARRRSKQPVEAKHHHTPEAHEVEGEEVSCNLCVTTVTSVRRGARGQGDEVRSQKVNL